MTLYRFSEITNEHSFLGGKGFALGLMKNFGLNVPDGIILDKLPTSESEWREIESWYQSIGQKKVAVRSSAVGEDSSEQSFAGQNSTYLNIDNFVDLKKSVQNCFQSMYRKSSTLYREHFLKEKANDSQMNVVIQLMVNPKFSGVFFSVDPRNNEAGWIVESIEGLGEDLVSGKKTPMHFEQKKVNKTTLFDLDQLVTVGNKVKDFFQQEIDMEWSIDHENALFVLQARPITALGGKSEEKRMIEAEIKRLKSTHSADTLWDGNTFAEWSNPPSELTFNIWQKAFSKDHAFSKALQKLGYKGIDSELNNETSSLLEKIFDRAYVNISMMAPLYFGPIPYRLDFNDGPKLKFDFSKMNLKTLLLTPLTMWRMISVSFRLSSERRKWLDECNKELVTFTQDSFRSKKLNAFSNLSEEELLKNIKIESELFYKEHLVWPLVLITLIESTGQSLRALLKGVIPDQEISSKINHWFSIGLHTVTMEMNREYQEASEDPLKRSLFLEKFGHRGPGELELANPRWIELGEKAFIKSTLKKDQSKVIELNIVEKEISLLNTYKKQVIEKEWLLLKEMLELREKWKMNLLSPYSHLRFLILELAKRKNIGHEIFWFNLNEILNLNLDLKKAQNRLNHAQLSKNIYLPAIVSLENLDNLFKDDDSKTNILKGETLSPGLVYGEIRVVLNPENIDTTDWPENTILVAESTDPGWTGLFLKSKAIIVEKGGVLSHCAIVAREMGLPAISGIKQCHLRFKNGDKVWVDGNNGRITLA